MPNVWVTTDLHLWSQENDNRHPYRTQRQIDDLANVFAQTLREDDILIFLGDLCDPEASDLNKVSAFVRSIPCTKYMCRGNHDTEDDAYYLEAGFDRVCDLIRMHNIIFSHKPVSVAPDELNVHGHLHTQKMSGLTYQHINAYAMRWNKEGPLLLLDDLLASATIQDPEIGEPMTSKRWEEMRMYVSLDHDHYRGVVDITDEVPLCPVDESTKTYPSSTLSKICDFCEWMDKNFQYGLRINGKWDPKRNTSSEDWDKFLVVQSPDELATSRVGVCWDYVSYEADYFRKNFPEVKYKTYYMQFFNEEDCPSHTILTFTLNGKHYYFENSFRRYAGVYEAGSEEDIINFVLRLMSDNPDPSIPKGELLQKWGYDVWEYDALDRALFGMHCQEYMTHVMDNGKCWKHTYHTPKKAVKKLNLSRISESADVLDEVIFDDAEDTKFWLADDEKSRKKIEKGEESEQSVVAIDESSNSAINRADIWYHMVPKGTDVSQGIVSPEYMMKTRMDAALMSSVAKYRDRMVGAWGVYPDRDPESLTDREVIDGLNKFRGKYGSKSIYLFRYPPAEMLGPNMAAVLAEKDIYEVDLSKVKDIVMVDYTVNDGPGKGYYDLVRPHEYFATYDDDAEKHGRLLFAGIPHVAVATRSGRIPPMAIKKVEDFTLYHGSSKKYNVLKAQNSPAYPDEKAVYGTPSYDFALAFAGGKWSDLQINQCMYNGVHVLTEILPGMFDKFFNCSGYVHYMHSAGFYRHSRSMEYISLWDVKPYKVEKIDNVLRALEKSGTRLYRYPDLPPFIHDHLEYVKSICDKWDIDYKKVVKDYRLDETSHPMILQEMAYEDAQDFMLKKLRHYCAEFNKKDKYFEQIKKMWKKEGLDSKDPPKLKPHLKYGNENQILFILVDGMDTDHANIGQVASYWNLVHDLGKALEKDPDIKSFSYITRINPTAEDIVGMYIELAGTAASESGRGNWIAWPKVTAKVTDSTNPNDWKSKKAVDIKFYNDKGAEIGEASVSGVDTDEPYLYNVEVYKRYRGKKYANSIMAYVIKEYNANLLEVESENTAAIELYKKHGFKLQYKYCEWHANMHVMARGHKVEKPEGLDESALNENFVGTVPDLEWHLDEWSPTDKNFLWICGLSGGGKTTLANELSKKYDVEVIHLDDLAQAAFVGKMANPNFTKRMSPTMQAYWNSTTDHIKMYKWGDQRLALETDKFAKWMIKNHAGDGKRYIIEGCEIMYMDADYLIEQPLIIKGTSAVRTTFWRFKRTYGQHRAKGENALKAFEHCMVQIAKIYKNGAMIAAENGLMRFKDILQAARDYNELAQQAMNEAVVETHPMDRDEKKHVAEKYGIRPVGQTHDEADKDDAIEKQKELDRKKKERLKSLEKGRKTQKRNRLINKIKSHLPGVKNEEADAVDDDAWYLDTGHSTEDNPAIGDHIPVYKDDLQYAEVVDEAVSGYRFELADKVQFFDRLDESAMTEAIFHPVYVVLMHTGSLVATAIKTATNCEFSHVSISFDSALKSMYSFGGHKVGKNGEPVHSGFKKESLDDNFFKDRKVPYAIYAVPCTKGQLDKMKKRLDYFVKNESKFYFDFTGLIKNFFGISDNPQNRWFCSRFVSDILNAGTPNAPLVKDPSLMRPEDFKSTSFAFHVDSGEDLRKINPKKIDRSAKTAFKVVKLKRATVNEATLHLYPDNPYGKQVLEYQLAMMDEGAVDGFIQYLQSFKIRLDNDGNILITRREFDQLDTHFRESLRMIKSCENAGNVQGVKDELCKINYMIELINQYYLRQDVKNLKPAAKDVRKDMLDLRSVMMNVFRQHLKWVTMQDTKWNFQRYYDNSKYGKNVMIPKKVVTDVGRTIITALA